MKYFLKVIIASFFSICFCYKTYAFDLKSLTDKLQKDLGNKLQITFIDLEIPWCLAVHAQGSLFYDPSLISGIY